ncbi:MAG: hypothetical protein P8P30_04465 [Rickettsiales bacterium]|nr:hypothetical protein [Rickettsiales bacterium]
MEVEITAFIHSEMGYITALVLIMLGLCDLVSGYYITRYRPDLLPIPAEKLKPIMMAVYFVSSFLVLIGIYMLYIRA